MNMATSSIVNDGDAIVTEIFIAAAPEDVFRALVDPQLVVKWWGGQGAGQSFRCTHFQSDLRAGGTWRSSGVDGDGRPFEAAGEYVEVDPPRLLVQTCRLHCRRHTHRRLPGRPSRSRFQACRGCRQRCRLERLFQSGESGRLLFTTDGHFQPAHRSRLVAPGQPGLLCGAPAPSCPRHSLRRPPCD